MLYRIALTLGIKLVSYAIRIVRRTHYLNGPIGIYVLLVRYTSNLNYSQLASSVKWGIARMRELDDDL